MIDQIIVLILIVSGNSVASIISFQSKKTISNKFTMQ